MEKHTFAGFNKFQPDFQVSIKLSPLFKANNGKVRCLFTWLTNHLQLLQEELQSHQPFPEVSEVWI
jgi:hypothetical protein